MVIEILDAKQEGYMKTLKVSRLTVDESFIVMKVQEDAIATGTTKSKDPDKEDSEWDLIKVHLVSYSGKDRNGQFTENVEEEMGWFPNGKLVHKFRELPLNVPIKVFSVKKEGNYGSFTVYEAEVLESVKSSNDNSQSDLKEKIKTMKAEGLDASEVAELLSIEFDMSQDKIKGLYEAM